MRGLTLTPRPVLTLSGRPFHGGLFRAQERAVRQQRTPRLRLYPDLICLNSARDGSVVHEVALELEKNRTGILRQLRGERLVGGRGPNGVRNCSSPHREGMLC